MQISLGEFVKYLVLLLQKNNIDLLLHKQESWHRLFYELKKRQEILEKPDFLKKLRFDWDGPYPESLELSEYLNALRWVGSVETNSPKFDRYWISKDMEELWQKQFEKLDEKTKQYLNLTVNITREEFMRVVSQT